MINCQICGRMRCARVSRPVRLKCSDIRNVFYYSGFLCNNDYAYVFYVQIFRWLGKEVIEVHSSLICMLIFLFLVLVFVIKNYVSNFQVSIITLNETINATKKIWICSSWSIKLWFLSFNLFLTENNRCKLLVFFLIYM